MEPIVKNDLINELETNFIEYAVACNTDRAIPNANDGLKPVAKRIIYCGYDCGFHSNKPHVKSANIVGRTMADFHPHGDSSIYGSLVHLSQSWIMRYPLIDFHGANGNIDGDGPAASRYTEARLSKLVEAGMLVGINKKAVDFIPNYSETEDEPIELPSIFPNLLCNPNAGIGVSLACSWAPHNLKEVANAIYDYIDGKPPMLPGPDFPTGGIVINKSDVPKIMETGRGTVRVRGKYHVEDGNKIVFTEIPYGVATEDLLNQIGAVCDDGSIKEISDIRNESNKKGLRIVIECSTDKFIDSVVTRLFLKTDLQKGFSYNQIALVDKTPTELNLKDCIKIYCEHNSNCIKRESKFDLDKTIARLDLIEGLLKALDHIDDIIALIKASESPAAAKSQLISDWGFNEAQAQAILDMKLSKLAKLEKEELIKEQTNLLTIKSKLETIIANPIPELRKRLEEIVKSYGDDRRTELIDIKEPTAKEKKDLMTVPIDCTIILYKNGLIKRVPIDTYKVQHKNGAGIKSIDQVVTSVISANTVDTILVFTNLGKVYKIKGDQVPEGTNASKGVPITSFLKLDPNEKVERIYSASEKDIDKKYAVFVTKFGMTKRVALNNLVSNTKTLSLLDFNEGDSIIDICFLTDEDIILGTKAGKFIKFNSTEISISSNKTMGTIGISLAENDEVRFCAPCKNNEEYLCVLTADGCGKRVQVNEFPAQKRGGKGRIGIKVRKSEVITGFITVDSDVIFLTGSKNSLCIPAKEIVIQSREGAGTKVSKNEISAATKI